MGTPPTRESWFHIDPEKRMLDWIAGLSDQISRAISYWPNRPDADKEIQGIILAAMGGSAMAGEVVFSTQPLGIPAYINRNEHLPDWVGKNWLCLASSYSGNTRETLSCYDEAVARGCRVLTMSSGGELARKAATQDGPHRELDPGQPPRTAMGQAVVGILWLLWSEGLIPDTRDQLHSTSDLLKSLYLEGLGAKEPWGTSIGRAALQLATKTTAIVSAGKTAPTALRWAQQLNENAKSSAFAATVPEMLHNLIEGIDDFSARGGVLVLLRDNSHTPTEAAAFDHLSQSVQDKGGVVLAIHSRGRSLLERTFSLMYFGDQVSYHVALLHGVDPTPVERIGRLKEALASR